MDNRQISQEELNNIPHLTLTKMYVQLSESFDAINKQLGMLQAQNENLTTTIKLLQEKVELLTQSKFGRKTEKLSDITSEQLRMDFSEILNVFNEIEALSEGKTQEEPDIETITYKRKKKKGKRDADLSGIEVVVEPTVELPEEKLKELVPYGYKRLPDYVYTDLEYIPATFKAHEHHIAVYAGNRDTGIVKANRPERLLKTAY